MAIIDTLKSQRKRLLLVLPKSDDTRPYNKQFFVCAFILGVWVTFFTHADWLTSGEMWAESATVFFAQLEAQNFGITYLLGQDAGYLSVPQRLIALAAHFLQLPTAFVPYFYEWSAVILVSLGISSICLPHFRSVIKNDWNRFALVTALQLVQSSDTVKHVSFTYLLAVLLAVVFLSAALDKSDKAPPLWLYVTPLLFASKLSIIAAVFPMLLFATIFAARRYWPLLIVFYAMLALNFARVAYSLNANIYRDTDQAPLLSSDLIDRLETFVTLCTAYFGGFAQVSWSPVFGDMGTLFQIILLMLLCAVWVFWLCRSYDKIEPYLFGAGAAMVVGNSFVLAIGLSSGQFAQLDSLTNSEITPFRWSVISIAGCVLMIYGSVSYLTVTFLSRLPALLTGAFFLIGFVLSGWPAMLIVKQMPTPLPIAWAQASVPLDMGQPVCALVGRYPWALYSGCRILERNNNRPFAPSVIKRVHDITPPGPDTNGLVQSFSILGQVDQLTDRQWGIDVEFTLETGKVRTQSTQLTWRGSKQRQRHFMIQLDQSYLASNISSIRLVSSHGFAAQSNLNNRDEILADWFGM